MKFYTENSAYEVDLKGKMIRRLNGDNDPTPYQGEDGHWKEYVGISPIRPHYPVTIIWEVSTDENGDPLFKSTVTSPVKKLDELTAGEAKEFFGK